MAFLPRISKTPRDVGSMLAQVESGFKKKFWSSDTPGIFFNFDFDEEEN